MAGLYLTPDQAIGELVLVAGVVSTTPNLLPWTAALADRWSLPIKLIYIEPAGASMPLGHLDSQLESRLIALRAHLPELRVESRTVKVSYPVSAWTDELRPHSLLIASLVPEIEGPPGTVVVVGPRTPVTPELAGPVLAVLDGPSEADRVTFAAESVGSTLGCPVHRLRPGEPLDQQVLGACFATVSALSPRLQRLLTQSRHPVLVVGL